MVSFDGALKGFIAKHGEDAVEAALTNYENQKKRSQDAHNKAQAQRAGLANLLAKAKSDPRVAEILKSAGLQVGV